MSFLNKIFNKGLSQTVEKPVFRFNSGFQLVGAQVRPKDTRTTNELLATIDYFAQKSPELQAFTKDLKGMNPKHLNLVADTMELASQKELTMTNINMNKKSAQTGKSLLEHLLSIYPKASKENPQAMEFAQEVINNTDTTTSKYFLAVLNGIFNHSQASEHLKATKPLIKPIAEQTLSGGYLGTFEKQKNFTDFISSFLTPKAKPEKIELVPKLCEAVDKVEGDAAFQITLDKFTQSDAPLRQVEENIAILPEVAQNAVNQGKMIDVVDFVNNNVNLNF